MNNVKTFLMLFCGVCGLVFCAPGAVAAQEVRGAALAQQIATVTATERKLFRRALRRHVPLLKFARGENYFPLSVSGITNNPGNKLLRFVEGDRNDRLLAKYPGGDGVPKLRSTFLRDIYPVLREPSLDIDYVLEQHGEDEQADYQADARRLQANSNYRDRVYGRIFFMTEGGKRVAWLQYWFFYYYNDFKYNDDPYGLHEGDWEMVQIKVDSDAKPTVAAYAQHESGSGCSWREMDTAGNHPVVYVGRGSHASYFHHGLHDLELPAEIGRLVRDHAEGTGASIGGSGRRFKFVTLGVNSPPWLNWQGHWGGTKKREGVHLADAESPRGPKFQGHGKWSDPEAFYQSVKGKRCE